MQTIIEPFRIKSVEPIHMTTADERRRHLQAAEYNLFSIPARHVMIDLLTDSGTGAMSSAQWAGVMRGDESYAGAESYYRFVETVREMTGFDRILPTHQGRAAERILFEALIGSPPAGYGLIVPGNAHFDTTRANIEHSGARAIDLLTEAGRTPATPALFKGNLDIAQLERLLDEQADKVPLVMLTVTCNSNGGQPVSLENIRAVRSLCDLYDKPLYLDAARFAENAWLIGAREPDQRGRTPVAIARETFDLADGAMISAKKDGLVNIGGVLLIRDAALFARASDMLILTEGYVTYGGLAGRDLEAMAIGFREVLDEDYLRYRVRSVQYLGEELAAADVRIVEPAGGHAVYLDASAFCPHLARSEFPGQAVACALYEHGGVRSCEIGSVMMGEHATMELVRLAIPRRTYTQSHIDYVVEVVREVHDRRHELPGFRIVEHTGTMRHFTARFEPVNAPAPPAGVGV